MVTAALNVYRLINAKVDGRSEPSLDAVSDTDSRPRQTPRPTLMQLHRERNARERLLCERSNAIKAIIKGALSYLVLYLAYAWVTSESYKTVLAFTAAFLSPYATFEVIAVTVLYKNFIQGACFDY